MKKEKKSRKGLLMTIIMAAIAAGAYFACTLGYKYYTVKVSRIAIDETAYIYITQIGRAHV